jgi:hypothetical protein
MMGSPGSEWQIWIGHQDSKLFRRGFVRHAFPKEQVLPKPLGLTVTNNSLNETQFFVWRLGHLVVLGYFSRLFQLKLKDSSLVMFRQLFPRKFDVRWPPLRSTPQDLIAKFERNAAYFFSI